MLQRLLVWDFWHASFQSKVRALKLGKIYFALNDIRSTDFTVWFGKKAAELVHRKAKRTDLRIKIMNEILIGIQVIKTYAWDKPFAKIVDQIRRWFGHFFYCSYFSASFSTLWQLCFNFAEKRLKPFVNISTSLLRLVHLGWLLKFPFSCASRLMCSSATHSLLANCLWFHCILIS